MKYYIEYRGNNAQRLFLSVLQKDITNWHHYTGYPDSNKAKFGSLREIRIIMRYIYPFKQFYTNAYNFKIKPACEI